MADALQYFQKMNITYLLLDGEAVEQRPYLQEVYHAEWSRHFTPVRSFSCKPGDRWIIKKMDVFKFTP